MNIFLLPKAIVLSVLAFFTSMINFMCPNRYTEEERTAVEKKLENRIVEMRRSVDCRLGEGVFDKIVDGRINVVEFLDDVDLEDFFDNCAEIPRIEKG